MSDIKNFHEDLKIRVPAVQEAIKRARAAFLAVVFASISSFLCLWNTYISFNRNFVFQPLPSILRVRPLTDAGHEEMRAELEKDLARAWVESQSVNVNLLGIHIGVCDFAVLDTIAMYLFAYYGLLSVRRENREVGQLLTDLSIIVCGKAATSEQKAASYATYSALCAYMVFNLNENDDTAFSGLSAPLPAKIGQIRSAFRALIYLPVAVIWVTILCDVISLFSQSEIAFGSPLRLTALGKAAIFNDGGRFLYVVLAELFAVVTAIAVYRLVSASRRYDVGTRAVLDEFRQVLIAQKAIPFSNDES